MKNDPESKKIYSIVVVVGIVIVIAGLLNICFRIRNFETAVSGKVKNLYGTAVFVLIFILIFEEKTHKEISPFSHGKSEL